MDAPLRYPANVPQSAHLPGTRRDLLVLSANQCLLASTILGLAELPLGASVAERTQQIAEYIGVLY